MVQFLSRTGLLTAIVAVLFGAVETFAAAADAVPGAVYSGWAADGAKVTFTVSNDGTMITSYRISGVPASTCDFEAGESAPEWKGTPISNNSFDYTVGTAISFKGRFTGPQSASGTFRLTQPAVGNAPACDSGTVSWTATTTSRGSGSGGPGGSGSGGPSGGQGQGVTGGKSTQSSGRRFTTRVALRRLTATRLGGRLSSSSPACQAGRTVILWRGTRRIGSTKSRRNGAYSFATVVRWRRERVRASVTRRRVQAGMCAAGSSKPIVA
jgi:hypothetical protein